MLAAVGFGVSDFVGGLAARRALALRVVLLSYPVALVMMGGLAIGVGGPISVGAIGWGSACGIALGLAGWWFYAALSVGPISVVSPVSAVLMAGVPVVVAMAQGDRPRPMVAVGIGLALAAIVLVGREAGDGDISPHRLTAKVVALTISAGVGFGLSVVFLAQAPAEAQLWPLLFARLVAAALIITTATAAGEARLPSGTAMKLALAAALLDGAGSVAMLFALREAPLALAGVVIALFPAVTVVLAIVVLHERAHRWQVVGLALTAVAVAMIAAG